jgi:curved DNA-binding protein CbpA
MTYYELLGVPRNATPEEIAKAYRDKARQFHPDKNPSPEAAIEIKKINEAYATLSDNNKRSMYNSKNPEPIVRPPKPKKTVVKKATGADYSRDPNLGNIINVPQRNVDIWGESWDKKKEHFVDSVRYEDQGAPDIRR